MSFLGIQSKINLGRAFGIPIRLDISVVILAAYFVLVSKSISIGITYALILLISITAHELGHSLAAIKLGCRVRDITLSLIGGVASISDFTTDKRKELIIAISGPAVSLVLCGIGDSYIRFISPFIPIATLNNIYGILFFFNMWLFLFNIIPAFPMDGGRIFRALLSYKLSHLKATFIAARLGKILAVCFGIWSIYDFNIFRICIAAFVFQAATNEYLMACHEAGTNRTYKSEDDNEVVISPPPYNNKKRPSFTDIFKER